MFILREVLNYIVSDSTCNELGTAHNLESSCKCKVFI